LEQTYIRKSAYITLNAVLYRHDAGFAGLSLPPSAYRLLTFLFTLINHFFRVLVE
jgi:hypothetical protein